MNTRTQTLALAVSCLVVVTACGSNDPAPTISQQPSSQAPSSPAPSTPAKTLTQDEQAEVNAEVALRRYYAVMDATLADPKKNDSVLKSVAIGTGLVTARNIVGFNRSKGRDQNGVVDLVSVKVLKKDLANDLKGVPPKVPTIEFRVCIDVSKVNVVDKSGKSVVLPGRIARIQETHGLSNYKYPRAAGWKVSYSVIKGQPC